MHIVISGASGLIGTALSRTLSAEGHSVTRLVRANPRDGEVSWDPARRRLDPAALEGCDAVVNLSGAGIGDKRWTSDYKRVLLASRVDSTNLLATTIAKLERKPDVFVSGSAVGYYGDRGDERLDETSGPGNDFLSSVTVHWEAATAPAEDAGVRTVHIRTGIVLSPDGGALKKQLPLFKLGVGGKFGSGKQWQSWISLDDEVAAIIHLLDADVSGAVNLTAPNPVTNAEFANTLGKVLHRPAAVPVPLFGPKLLLGGELVDALLGSSQRALPAVLVGSGFVHRHTTLEHALEAMLRA